MRVIAFVSTWVCLASLSLAGAEAKEHKLMQEVDGVWKLTKMLEDGKANEDEVKRNQTIVRKDGVQESSYPGSPVSTQKFKIDSKKQPKHIDFINAQGGRTLGIYELNKNEMRVAIFSDAKKQEKERPTDFKEDGKIIAVYQRLKKE